MPGSLNMVNDWKCSKKYIFEVLKLKCCNLSNKIDLLSLDVEGAEIEVLNGFDFKKYKFRYILIESRDDEKITKYLNDFNYKLLEKISKRDLFFKHNDF